jgi:hypothetical protein
LSNTVKVLVVGSNCLTAITNRLALAWINKGTRWYIGWAVPVFFDTAYKFMKKFYSTWCGRYEMNPDKVKDAFDAVQGAFSKCRPRIFGR